jgi:uncharacterized protein YoxC
MPRPKRNSRVLANSERQLESMLSIDLNLDFNNGLTTQAYADLIDEMRQKLATYNTLLSTVDDAQREVELLEQSLTSLSKRLMTNVAARYGEESREYRMAGGKPRSKVRRSTLSSKPSNSSIFN